ncbi:acyl-CoA dehydrogenase family protein [Actinomycetospora aeridis]|uniref:Acyl-CoA dehydrogenase family protein n=1 Tax=Actinomycetospora aeridis TaxID=3129231 RepID=A0ABU8NBP0_9PSEU
MTDTLPTAAAPSGTPPDAFEQVLAEIHEGELAREEGRTLPWAPVERLRALGFGALRVPRAYGGGEAAVPELIALVTRLAEADANVAHLLRGHFGHVEQQLVAPASARRDRWLEDAVAGGLVGNAASERGDAPSSAPSTVLRREGERLLLSGTKYYSTGTIFADWITVNAQLDGDRVTATVPAQAPGVRRDDDWDGFGQRLTGSGTTVFDDVDIDPDHVADYRDRVLTHSTAFFQLYLLAVLAGIGRAVVRDTVGFVRPRRRSFVTGRGAIPRDDPLVQEIVGRVSAASFTADELVASAARAVQAAVDTAGPRGLAREAVDAAELAVYRTQLVVVDTVLGATNELFEVGGASATSSGRGLDRHWRNARTLASHNPAVFKARLIGDHLLNGVSPSAEWSAWSTPTP